MTPHEDVAAIRSRQAGMEDRVRTTLSRAQPNSHADTLLRRAITASSTSARVMWLRQAASAWAEPVAQVSACRKGCSHCCHIPLAVSDIEARLISQRTGRPMRAVPDAPSTGQVAAGSTLPGTPADDAGYTRPCPFLRDGECSIYEHRPLACRTHLNLDEDDFLCRLRPGMEVEVPYADATLLKAAFVDLQPAARWADIRAFFG